MNKESKETKKTLSYWGNSQLKCRNRSNSKIKMDITIKNNRSVIFAYDKKQMRLH